MPQSAAIARVERGLDVGDLPCAHADQGEASGHRADLMMQETARLGVDDDALADPDDIEPVECAQRAVGLALHGAEGREVVLADQRLRGLVHGGGVELFRDAPDKPFLERQQARGG